MTPYRIKRHRKRSNKVEGGNHMTLVPFIDMLTILVVFLLVHTSDVDVLPNTKNISIPESISDKKPESKKAGKKPKHSIYVGVKAGGGDDHQGRLAGRRPLDRDAGADRGFAGRSDCAAEGCVAEPGRQGAGGRGERRNQGPRSDDPR